MQEIKISDRTDNELIGEAKGLYWNIHVCDSYDTYDLWRYEAIANELEDRGYMEVTSVDFLRMSDDYDDKEVSWDEIFKDKLHTDNKGSVDQLEGNCD